MRLLVEHGASLSARACGDFFYSNPHRSPLTRLPFSEGPAAAQTPPERRRCLWSHAGPATRLTADGPAAFDHHAGTCTWAARCSASPRASTRSRSSSTSSPTRTPLLMELDSGLAAQPTTMPGVHRIGLTTQSAIRARSWSSDRSTCCCPASAQSAAHAFASLPPTRAGTGTAAPTPTGATWAPRATAASAAQSSARRTSGTCTATWPKSPSW